MLFFKQTSGRKVYQLYICFGINVDGKSKKWLTSSLFSQGNAISAAKDV